MKLTSRSVILYPDLLAGRTRCSNLATSVAIIPIDTTSQVLVHFLVPGCTHYDVPCLLQNSLSQLRICGIQTRLRRLKAPSTPNRNRDLIPKYPLSDLLQKTEHSLLPKSDLLKSDIFSTLPNVAYPDQTTQSNSLP